MLESWKRVGPVVLCAGFFVCSLLLVYLDSEPQDWLLVIVAFTCVSLTSLIVALCFAELASAIPYAGGAYAQARVAFGPAWARTAGYCERTFYAWAACAAYLGLLGTVIGLLVDEASIAGPVLLVALVSFAAVFFPYDLNHRVAKSLAVVACAVFFSWIVAFSSSPLARGEPLTELDLADFGGLKALSFPEGGLIVMMAFVFAVLLTAIGLLSLHDGEEARRSMKSIRRPVTAVGCIYLLGLASVALGLSEIWDGLPGTLSEELYWAMLAAALCLTGSIAARTAASIDSRMAEAGLRPASLIGNDDDGFSGIAVARAVFGPLAFLLLVLAAAGAMFALSTYSEELLLVIAFSLGGIPVIAFWVAFTLRLFRAFQAEAGDRRDYPCALTLAARRLGDRAGCCRFPCLGPGFGRHRRRPGWSELFSSFQYRCHVLLCCCGVEMEPRGTKRLKPYLVWKPFPRRSAG